MLETILKLKQTHEQTLSLKEFSAQLVKVCKELDALQDAFADYCEKQHQL